MPVEREPHKTTGEAPGKRALPTHKGSAAERDNRARRTFQQLRELIVHGRLAPGTRIVEADLAHRLGVSRTPVRDALNLLQQEGYIMVNWGGGSKSRLAVTPLTKEDARELYWIVGHVEGLAARATAQLETTSRTRIVEELRRLNDGLREMAQTGQQDPNRIFDLDLAFHRTIVEVSAGPRLRALHNAIKPQTERYWRLYASAIVEQLGISVSEHDEIIKAIEDGDCDGAEQGLRVNWQNGAERLSRVIDTHGERGTW